MKQLHAVTFLRDYTDYSSTDKTTGHTHSVHMLSIPMAIAAKLTRSQ